MGFGLLHGPSEVCLHHIVILSAVKGSMFSVFPSDFYPIIMPYLYDVAQSTQQEVILTVCVCTGCDTICLPIVCNEWTPCGVMKDFVIKAP